MSPSRSKVYEYNGSAAPHARFLVRGRPPARYLGGGRPPARFLARGRPPARYLGGGRPPSRFLVRVRSIPPGEEFLKSGLDT